MTEKYLMIESIHRDIKKSILKGVAHGRYTKYLIIKMNPVKSHKGEFGKML